MNRSLAATNRIEARRWLISGHVQGVGFRPFVYRLAHRLGVNGWVQNQRGRVEVIAEGEAAILAAFARALVTQAPAIAHPVIDGCESIDAGGFAQFDIRASSAEHPPQIHVPPDYFTCEACLAELSNPQDRRYRYPFINCTQCGPRYTIIEALPYERASTTLAGFPLCDGCQGEYANPLDRRFHAEPIACRKCGPQLEFVSADTGIIDATEHALRACIKALQAGHVVAVKGIGGYHLMCDARNDIALERLRAKKPRPHKPLAVMFPARGDDALAAVYDEVELRATEAEWLTSPTRPIVLALRKATSTLCEQIAPGLNEIGVMLPYSALHHLLSHDFGGPLVATSGNISGEPVLTDKRDVDRRLTHVADARLHHNRPIERPADDCVFRTIHGRPRPIRLGRGCAPLELELPFTLPRPVLAVGAHLKNTVALGWNQRVLISPHIGEMGTPRSQDVFEHVIADLQRLYGIEAQAVVCDAHPGYRTTRWAKTCGLAVYEVFHHHAHASALVGEYLDDGPWLVFTWDGVGYGKDGTLWGGEALLGRPASWRRVASMRPFHLPGGDKAGREPWRSAAALCWALDQAWPGCPDQTSLVHQAWQKRIVCPQTSAVGRLFDAAAALAGGIHETSYEGQGPMQLEALSNGQRGELITLALNEDASGVWRSDWAPLIPHLLNEGIERPRRAADFHTSLAHCLLQQALRLRDVHGAMHVGLCGGVFQNRVLTEQAVELLQSAGFTVKLSTRVPCNDAGISFGQIVEFGAMRNRTT